MDQDVKLVCDNPLFSPTQESQDKCWDVLAEITDSKKNTLQILEKNACERVGVLNNSDSQGKDDEESEVMSQLRMLENPTLKEEEEEEEEDVMHSKKDGNIRSYSVNPVIIQAGGVASYHPIYSPYAPRPRFRRYRSNPFNEERNIKLGQYNPEIHRSEEENKVKLWEKGSLSKEGGNCEANEAIVNDSSDSQPAQEAINVEETRNKIILRDADHKKQSQLDAGSHDSMEPKPNSLIRPCVQRSTIQFKTCKSGVFKTSLILVGMFFAVGTASTVIFQLNNNTGTTSAQDQNCRDNIYPRLLDTRLRVQNWFLTTAAHSENVGRLKDSSKKVLLSSCRAFSSSASRGAFMAEEISRQLISFTREFVGNFTIFREDLTRSTAEEFPKLSGSFESNKTTKPLCTCPEVIHANDSSHKGIDEAPEHEKNEINLFTENRSGDDVDLIEGVANSTDPESDHRQEEDQMPTDQKNSTEGLHNLSPEAMEVEKIHFNNQTLVVSDSRSESRSATSGLNKFTGVNWTFSAPVDPMLVIPLVLIGAVSFYWWPFSSSKGQGMKRRKSRSRQIEAVSPAGLTPCESPQAFGSYVEHVDLSSSQGSRSKEIKSTSICTPVRRSMRIRNKSLSPLSSPPSFRTPTRAI